MELRFRCALTFVLASGMALVAQPQGRFSSPQPVGGLLAPGLDAAPTLSADGRTIVFWSQRAGSVGSDDNGSDLWIATRRDAGDDFDPPIRMGPAVNAELDEFTSVLTPDGLVLIFSSQDVETGSSDIYIATRETAYDTDGGPIPFENRRKVEELSSDDVQDWVSGLDQNGTIYLTYGTPSESALDVHVASFDRETLTFSEAEPLCGAVNGPTSEAIPTISWDGRTLLWGDLLEPWRQAGNAQLYLAWRDATEACFEDLTDRGPLQAVNASTDWSPRLSYDWPAAGSKLYFVRNRQSFGWTIFESTWVPDPDEHELVDDFSDGELLDGSPVEWIESCIPVAADASSGDVVLRAEGGNNIVGFAVGEELTGDVSVRTRFRFLDERGQVFFIPLHGNPDPCNCRGYYGWVSPAGTAGIDVDCTTLEFVPLPANEDDEDWMLEFASSGDFLELRVWVASEPRPERPAIRVEDDTIPRVGQNGIAFQGSEGQSSEAVVRFVRVAWSTRPPPPPRFLRADADNADGVNITDPVFTLDFLFTGGPAPGCEDAADSDDSGAIDITDPIYSLAWLFLGGPEPPTPFLLGCGVDGSEDALDCVEYDCGE